MARFLTDFSEYTTDAQPSDWSEIWVSANIDWSVKSGSYYYGSKYLLGDLASSGRHALQWDDITAGQDFDAAALIQPKVTGNFTGGIVVRASGGAGAENGYAIWLDSNNNKLALRRYSAGAGSQDLEVHSHTIDPDIWYWVRVRIADNIIKAKVWDVGTAEPSAWDINYTDASEMTTDGKVALATYSEDCWVDLISIGTGGDAPWIVPREMASSTAVDTASWAGAIANYSAFLIF